jgi:PAS domain S-box-containing protein
MTGHTRDEATRRGWDWRTGSAPETAARDEQAMGEIRSRGWWDSYEKDYVRGDGSRLPVRLSSAPLPGEPRRVVVIAQDISEQRESESRRDLLMREVEHRAKNSLAVVQATLRLGARHVEGESRALVEAVDGRIRAIAGAQTLLREHRWEGAELAAVLRGTLAPFTEGGGEARVRIEGPPFALLPDAVQPLAMAFHEFATNAAKYGALAHAAGRLEIGWDVDDAAGLLRLRWRERGGGSPGDAPVIDGFGARLVDAMLAGQLGGSFERRFTDDGIVFAIALPLARIRRNPAVPVASSA